MFVSSLHGMLGFDMVKRGAYNIPKRNEQMTLKVNWRNASTNDQMKSGRTLSYIYFVEE